MRSKILEFPFHLKYWKWIRLAILISVDAVTISVSYYLSFCLRLDTLYFPDYWLIYTQTLPLVILLNIISFSSLGMYKQLWRHANFSSGILIIKCVVMGTTLVFLTAILYPAAQIPRSVPLISFFLSAMAITLQKFSWRLLLSIGTSIDNTGKKNCLIYGAGRSGELFIRHLQGLKDPIYRVVGFIDDDKNIKNRVVHGVKILGSGDDMEKIAAKYKVDHIIIAIDNAKGSNVSKIYERCIESKLTPLIMPDINQILKDNLVEPRPIDITDLLKRAPIIINLEHLEEVFKGKSIIVTGAGGSIGSELCRQIIKTSPEKLLLLDSCEYNLYKIDQELSQITTEKTHIVPILGSVTNKKTLENVFRTYIPDIVFHAAAYKHVPLVESNVLEAIVNNIEGTKNVAEFAVKFGADRFILISSDKAVKPTNVMGATKRACEILVQCMHKLYGEKIRFSIVRFGNVLCSSGSVIPLFMEQIKKGGPVTVTHKEVTRYFMLTKEAVGLVLQTVLHTDGGEIFILDMGKPVNIYRMAEQLIRLSGKEPHKDIEIEVIGLRPGEKLYEELLIDGCENHKVVDDIFIAKPEDFNHFDAMKAINQLIYLAQECKEERAVKELELLCGGNFIRKVNRKMPAEMAFEMRDR
ncbi:MAG: polysaccharide biosynthesis protein [Oligoflexales bacterium]|nr:polysaccharide biosynthesis protein [Oligoflexales bacterium]